MNLLEVVTRELAATKATSSSNERQSSQAKKVDLRLLVTWIASFILVFVAGNAQVGFAQEAKSQQAKYTDLRSITSVALDQELGALVDFEGSVTHVDHTQKFIIVQEGADAIFVLQPDVAEVTSGNRVRVVGRLGEGDLLPIVSESTVTVVGTEEMLPSPKTSLATSLARMLAIGLGALMLIFTLAAFWLKLLKAQVSQEGRFEGIFDSAGCPIIVLNGNLELIDANDYASELTEYSKAELRKMSFTEIDTHKPAEEIKKVMLKVMEFRDVAIFPTKIQTSDKKVFDVEVHCRNLTQSEDPAEATYIAIFPDVTKRNKYEKELKEARDEAIKANNAKSQFVASMSHELRTPLNGVIGMTQLLENTELTSTQADYLAACRTSGETLLTVIGDVLDFSKMEAGKLELEPQPTKLIPFIENVVRATSLQQGTRHTDLASFVDPRLDRSVMVDDNRLRQVIFNLIGNAIKFTAKGSITVTANCTQVTTQYADVRFTVSDTGIGIPADRIEGLFEAFEQIDSSTTREFGGTGLGLTICKQIVDLMDGKIHVESVEGQGSDFSVEVRLPFAAEEQENLEGEKEFVATGQSLAVVGMSAPIAKILRQMFKAYQVKASFFDETAAIPDGVYDVVLLNSKGDWESVRQFIQGQTEWSDNAPIVIPVVPADCIFDQQKWKRQGVAEPIFKPFTQSRFLQPVDSREERGDLLIGDQASTSEQLDRAPRILICEDNVVNQMFANEVCRNAGIQVVVCENGLVGIETLQRDSNFDAIFMDCNMPIMDGFAATRKIVEMTETGVINKIPVIALTANALASDRKKCLDSGMDDYLAKPFEIEDFIAKVRSHTNLSSKLAPTKAPAKSQTKIQGKPQAKDRSQESQEPVFNLEKLLNQFDDRAFVLGLAKEFVSSLPEYRENFQGWLVEPDADQVINVTHRLKGSSATVQACRINALALEIESAGRAGQLEDLEAQIATLLLEFDNFVNHFDDQVNSDPNLI